jgi:hypothetical protein
MNMYLVQTLLLATMALSAPAWAQVFTEEEARAHEARVSRAYTDVKEGDSKARVLEVAGEPATITPATEIEDETWIYFSGHYKDVSISFKDDKVTNKVQSFINTKESPVTEPPRF